MHLKRIPLHTGLGIDYKEPRQKQGDPEEEAFVIIQAGVDSGLEGDSGGDVKQQILELF